MLRHLFSQVKKLTNTNGSQISLPAGFGLRAFASLGSTNDEAKILANQGISDGTVIWAAEQTVGRGRQGRNWTSPPGNLYASVLLRDIGPMAQAAQLSFVTALAMADAISQFIPKPDLLTLKWPNDLLLDGAKICGILLESGKDPFGHDWIVIGTGVNVNSHPDNTIYSATNLHQFQCDVSVENLLSSYIYKLSEWHNRWRSQGFAPIRASWLNRAAKLGQVITVKLPAHKQIEGVFRDMNADGAIEVQLANGTIETVSAGDVFFN